MNLALIECKVILALKVIKNNKKLSIQTAAKIYVAVRDYISFSSWLSQTTCEYKSY